MNTLTQHSQQNSRQPSLSMSILSKTRSLNRCRERVRRERALLLKECASTTFRGCPHVEELRGLESIYLDNPDLVRAQVHSQTKFGKRATTTFSASAQRNNKYTRTNKSVWRGVINTFMRNGSKLRYQGMLRKALLEL